MKYLNIIFKNTCNVWILQTSANYKILLWKIKENLPRDNLAQESQNLVLRCQFFPNWSIDSMNLNRNLNKLLIAIAKFILNFIWKRKGPKYP
jgi:hypothetical protein